MFIIFTINYKANTYKERMFLVLFTGLRCWSAVWWCLHQTVKRVLCPKPTNLVCTFI